MNDSDVTMYNIVQRSTIVPRIIKQKCAFVICLSNLHLEWGPKV